jgi:hypothetical protein
MKKLNRIDIDLKRYKIVNRIFLAGMLSFGLWQAPSLILGQRNENIIEARNEPIITTIEGLSNCVEVCKKEIGLGSNISFEISSRDMTSEPRNGFCMPLGKDHYKIVLDLKYRKKVVVEHEVYHAWEMQTGKIKTDSEGKLKIWDYWPAEWRAQNYCLRNYRNNKNIGIGIAK